MKIRNVLLICYFVFVFVFNIPFIIDNVPVCAASNIFVSVSGDDGTGDGSIGNPFRTILRGLNATSPGDTVMIRGGSGGEAYYYAGVYYWTASGGTQGNPITITNYNDERVVINTLDTHFGGGNPNIRGLFEFQKQNWVVVDGLEFHNATKFCIGLHEGAESQYVGNITIQNCYFFNSSDGAVHTDAYRSGSPDHLAVYDIIIRDNTGYNNNNGWYNTCGQETFSMFECKRFHIYNNTLNLGWKINIDAKAGSSDGEIYNNTINTSHPDINPYYFSGPTSFKWNGGGITLDGASTFVDNISVFNNTIYGNKTGITISGESGGTPSNISIYNNILNLTGDTNWQGVILWHKDGAGTTQIKDNITIKHNTFYTSNKPIRIDEFDYNIINLVIANNIIDTDGAVIGIDWENDTTNFTITNNLFNVSSSDYYGVNNINGSPLFNDPNVDFDIDVDSPARDNGTNLYSVGYDINGTSRPQNLNPDMGAFEFEDGTPPEVRIRFAGNPGDWGGPYYEPPFESGNDYKIYPTNGYYTNSTKQTEDYIFINVSVLDPESNITDVWLNWYDDGVWTNWTYAFIPDEGIFWYYNTSPYIEMTCGNDYSFDVVANTTTFSVIYPWNKTGLGGNEFRRIVQLNCNPTLDLEYTPLYLWEGATLVSDDLLEADRQRHDQGTDGSKTDVGFIKTNINDGTMQSRYCGQFILFYPETNDCIEEFTIYDMYVHAWWSNNRLWTYMGQRDGRGTPTSISVYDKINFSTSNARSNISVAGLPGWVNSSFKLGTGLVENINIDKTENNIYEFMFKMSCELGGNQSPCIVSNRSVNSFVIFNIYDNYTLDGLDTDSDGMSDYEELWENFTNPFVSDTDYDGVNDWDEVNNGTDPNNYTDFVPSAPGPWVNTPPTIEMINPSNHSIDVDLYTNLSVRVNDSDGNNSEVNWYFNDSGSWIHRGVNNSVLNETVELLNLLNASVNDTDYEWRVTAYDGHDNVSKSFNFTTKDVIIIRPTGQKTLSSFNQKPIDGLWDKWDKINESVSDENGTYINNSEAGLVSIRLNYSNISENINISYVKACVRCLVNNTDNYGSKVTMLLQSGENFGSAFTNHTHYVQHSFYWSNNPETGNPWDVSDINGNTLWIFSYSDSAANENETRITQAWLEIGYNISYPGPQPPTSFLAVSKSDTKINLTWVTGENCTQTHIQRKKGAVPTSINDGTTVYNGSLEYFDDTGLDMGNRYFYSAWGYNSTTKIFSSTYIGDSDATRPGNVTNFAMTDNSSVSISLSWIKGLNSSKTVIRYSSVDYPATWDSGSSGYNGTGLSTTVGGLTPNTVYYFSAWAWEYDSHTPFSVSNKTLLASTVAYGTMVINVYKEPAPWIEIENYTVFIKNQNGSQIYYNTSCNNPHNINLTDLPLGDNVVVQVSKTGYYPRIKYMDLEEGSGYYVDFYLAPNPEGGGNSSNPDYVVPDDGSNESDNESYASHYIINIEDQTQNRLKDVKVTIERYINTTDQFETIYILYTDGNGEIGVNLIPNVVYQVTLEKVGYITEYEDWIPPEIVYSNDVYKTFVMIIESFTPGEPEIPFEEITFTAIRSGTIVYLNYSDVSLNTSDTSVYLYEINISGGNTTLIFSQSLSDNNSWSLTKMGVNGSNDHKVVLYYNSSIFGSQRLTRIIRRDITPVQSTSIDVFLNLLVGSNPFGWANFLLFLFLVAGLYYADEKDANLILMLVGGIFLFLNVIIGFSSTLFTVAGGVLPGLFFVAGIIGLWKQRREG